MRIIALLCIFSLLGALCAPARAQAGGDQDYALGVAEYKKGNYARAVAYFKTAVATASVSNHCIRKLYLGHSYVGLKELGMAVKTYRDIEASCHGSPEAKLATKCIEDLMDPAKARAVNASQPASSRTALAQRIEVLDVYEHLPQINPSFIHMVKKTVADLRHDFYEVLDRGGCNVTVAQNIIYKWPNAYNISTPGAEHLRLSQDYGLTQGLDIYVWERPIYVGNILGKPFPIDYSQAYLRIQLYRVACHVHGIDENKEYLEEYKKDVEKLKTEGKLDWLARFFIDQKVAGPAQLAGCIVENYLHKDVSPVLEEMFPKSYAWIKKRLKL